MDHRPLEVGLKQVPALIIIPGDNLEVLRPEPPLFFILVIFCEDSELDIFGNFFLQLLNVGVDL